MFESIGPFGLPSPSSLAVQRWPAHAILSNYTHVHSVGPIDSSSSPPIPLAEYYRYLSSMFSHASCTNEIVRDDLQAKTIVFPNYVNSAHEGDPRNAFVDPFQQGGSQFESSG